MFFTFLLLYLCYSKYLQKCFVISFIVILSNTREIYFFGGKRNRERESPAERFSGKLIVPLKPTKLISDHVYFYLTNDSANVSSQLTNNVKLQLLLEITISLELKPILPN